MKRNFCSKLVVLLMVVLGAFTFASCSSTVLEEELYGDWINTVESTARYKFMSSGDFDFVNGSIHNVGTWELVDDELTLTTKEVADKSGNMVPSDNVEVYKISFHGNKLRMKKGSISWEFEPAES